MTKKDYIAFAQLFRDLPEGVYTCPDVLEVCLRTARLFAADNGRFDRDRYLEACGVKREVGLTGYQET